MNSHMSLSRRRSCAQCVKSKRRCDLRAPACNRCRAKRVSCIYPPLLAGSSREAVQNQIVPSRQASVSVTPYSTTSQAGAFESFDIATNIGDFTGLHNYPFEPNPSLTTLPHFASPVLDEAANTLLDPLLFLDSGYSIPPGLGATLPRWPLTPTSTSNTASAALTQEPTTVTSIFIPRTEYAASRLAIQAHVLATEGRTGFIHHTQVSKSGLLQEALAASALHATRNASNEALIRSEVSRRASAVADFIRYEGASVDFDLLPCVQALAVYQCIRLYASSDIVQQGQAERDGSLLLALTLRLREQLQPLKGDLGWLAWVQQEAVRRTVLFADLVDGVYTFLRTGRDDSESRVAHMSFYAQAGLWDARSAVEWRAVWARSPSFEATIITFESDIADARPDDLDELGIIILALKVGMEKMEEWTKGDARVLKKLGLRPE